MYICMYIYMRSVEIGYMIFVVIYSWYGCDMLKLCDIIWKRIEFISLFSFFFSTFFFLPLSNLKNNLLGTFLFKYSNTTRILSLSISLFVFFTWYTRDWKCFHKYPIHCCYVCKFSPLLYNILNYSLLI